MVASSLSLSPNPTTFTTSPKPSFSPSYHTTRFIKFPNTSQTPTHLIVTHSPRPSLSSSSSSIIPRATASSSTTQTSFHGLCYVVGDNIDTNQIIPAEHLTLVPSNPAEYKKLGSYALIGLPSSYTTRFVEPNENKTKYSIVIGCYNFGCGSSREHAPVALGLPKWWRSRMRRYSSRTRWQRERYTLWNRRVEYVRSVGLEIPSPLSSRRAVWSITRLGRSTSWSPLGMLGSSSRLVAFSLLPGTLPWFPPSNSPYNFRYFTHSLTIFQISWEMKQISSFCFRPI